VDTYDTLAGVRAAVEVAGPRLGAVRLDSGDLAALARQVRGILDGAGATGTQIVATSDLDEYRIAELAGAPIDRYGVGTSVVTGSGSPAAGLVFKVVEVDGRPVAKRSSGGKSSQGGEKRAFRAFGKDGIARAEIVRGIGPGSSAAAEGSARPGERPLVVPLMRGGQRVEHEALSEARARHAAAVAELPAAGRALHAEGPALAVVRE
jgi:nicotinate phosphoribosyltransferase